MPTNEMGYIVVRPSTIKDAIDDLSPEIEQLNVDVGASSARDSFKKYWKQYYDGWKTFAKEGWLGHGFLETTLDKVKDYRKRAIAWQKALAAEGGRVSAPPIQDKGKFPWGKALLAAGGAWALFWGIPNLIRSFREKPVVIRAEDYE